MKNFRMEIITLVMLSLFLSPAFILNAGTTIMSGIEKNERPVSLADNVLDDSRRNDPVSILVYTEFADVNVGGEYDNTMNSINAEYGYKYNYANLTDYRKLATVINDYDILLILEQENAYVSNMSAVHSLWEDTLVEYISDGGIVILMDYDGFLNPVDERFGITSRIVNSTDLILITEINDLSYSPVYLHNTHDALAFGVASNFGAPDGSLGFVTTSGVDVIRDGDSGMVWHKTIGKGHLVLLGFDLYATEVNCVKMLGNSIRLHHHVVFDESHSPIFTIGNEFYQYALDLVEQGFAVSTMSTFDSELLNAADILVLTACFGNYSPELDIIESFVINGGGLFVVSDYGGYGDPLDPIVERFGYERVKWTYYQDSDDYSINPYWPLFDASNVRSHSVTLNVQGVALYACTGYNITPSDAFPILVGDSDNTGNFGGIPDNGTVLIAASKPGKGRLIVFPDIDMLDSTSDTNSLSPVNYLEQSNEILAVNAIRWLLAAGIEEKTVLFDHSHNPQYRLQNFYVDFGYFLTLNGYNLQWMTAFDENLITDADILVIVDGSIDYTAPEIETIVSYVGDGGSLFLMGDWTTYSQQIAPIGAEFGLVVNNTRYLIDTNDYNTYDSVIPYTTSNFASHPIMQGISRIEFDRSCGFSSVGAGVALVRTDNDNTSVWSDYSPAPNVPVLAATTYNKGRIVFAVDMELFGNADPDIDGVIDLYESDNDILNHNMFSWLIANRAPAVDVTFPNGGEVLNGTITITWDAMDLDDDYLTFDIYLSDNNGTDWTTLTAFLDTNEFEWNTTTLQDSNSYMIRVVVSDGKLTDQDQSDSPFSLDNQPDVIPIGFDPMLLLFIGGAIVVIVIIIVVVKKMKAPK